MRLSGYIAAAALAALMASCNSTDGWTVDGVVSGEVPAGSRIALENFYNGTWVVLDSLEVNNRSAFGYEASSPLAQPELMRLTLPGAGSVYFPVDSADNIEVDASAGPFALARVYGTPAAEAVSRVDSLVNDAVMRGGAHAALADDSLRRELVSAVIADTSGIVAYYVVSKSVAGQAFFRADDPYGNRVYGAAAQVFALHRPDDPRGTALRQAYFDGRRALGRIPETQTVDIPQAGLIDIERYDYTGTLRRLSDVASQGKVVLLSFTSYDIPGSPAYNALLNEIYTRYHDRGLEIYQIAFDDNEAMWKAAAVNLPWITVWNSPSEGNAALAAYNVGSVPLTYIIDRNGEIGRRVEHANDLSREVAQYF